ncbi:Hypp8000 [Branchiostoma lanceolatum]|uniref:Hypp8000 protein n=1 Tax=Branchiostoma lanceolatum TaxID=7740 RepID=A0A8J9Z4U4_BRALA|nr:Hypp8000 [Branchiostoma lanceolatum]
MAYVQQAKWDVEEQNELMAGELSEIDDFIMEGEKQPIEDVVEFFKERGHEFSVYTIDWLKDAVLFVKTKEETDLDQLKLYSSFMQAQRENGVEVLMIPRSDLQDVADSVAPEVEHMQEIFMYTTGRCGSTVLVNAADVLPSVQGVHLLDVYNVVADAVLSAHEELPDEDEDEDIYRVVRNDDTATALLKNVTTLLNYYFLKNDPLERSTIMYSLAPDGIVLGNLMAKARPKAKTAFMYRNGLKFYESHLRLLLSNDKRHYLNFQKAHKLGRAAFCWEKEYESVTIFGDDPELDNDDEERDIKYYIITLWQGTLHRALKLQAQDQENFFHAVLNYETLVEKKSEAVQEMMEKLGIEVDISDADIEVPLAEVFSTEALAGSCFSTHPKRENDEYQPHPDVWVGEWDRDVFEKVCKSTRWEPSDPDFVFPGTIC